MEDLSRNWKINTQKGIKTIITTWSRNTNGLMNTLTGTKDD